jgi:hypothetical protein
VIEFTHDQRAGRITQSGPVLTVSCYDGELTYTLIATYLQSGDSESVIIKWQCDCFLEITHNHPGLTWVKHWELFLEQLPESVRAVVATHRDELGFGNQF